MSFAAARPVDAREIPVIDIGGLRDGSSACEVGAALHRASSTLGFIYVAGHGLDAGVIDRARAAAHRFFRAEVEAKRSVTISAQHRGWLAAGKAKMQDDVLPDAKESFVFGAEPAPDEAPWDHPLRGPNQWPAFVPELRAAAMDFFAGADAVARHLLRGFALGLSLPETFFLRTAGRPLSRASVVYYPPQDAAGEEPRFGVGPHTDFGVLTVLCQDDVGGLQVQGLDGQWLEAPPIDGTLVVNVGDLLARWTGGAYKSTPHRVVNRSGRERLSLVLAFDPAPETVIDPRETLGPAYDGDTPPTTCGDYLLWRFQRAFAYRTPARGTP